LRNQAHAPLPLSGYLPDGIQAGNALRYYCNTLPFAAMIESFKDKETEKVWNREFSKKLPHDIQERALMKLQQLHAAGDLKDLSIPASNQLEPMKGNRKGQHSIRINMQWRICFKWNDGHAEDVEITDYH
jgi:proteic killer suppression protein